MATGTDKSKQPRLHYGWVVLAMGAMVVFASLGLGRFAYSVVLPAMREGLGMDNRGAGALATANLIGYLSFSVIGGLLAARFGPRRVIAAGLMLAAVGMAMTGLARSIAAAAVWRALVGIGSGASNVPVMGLMAAWFAPRLAPAPRSPAPWPTRPARSHRRCGCRPRSPSWVRSAPCCCH